MKPSSIVSAPNRSIQFLLVAIAIAGCLFIIQAAVRHGLSQALIIYSLTAGNLSAANKAIELTPNNARAHLADAALLTATGNPKEAVAEAERAVALRPADYFLWTQLGLLRDQTGDSAGALQAFDEAVKRAPFYSQPRWNRGNVLLRSGEYEAAFKDLNQAAASNPEFVPNLIDLAWGISRGDVGLTEQLAEINTDSRRIAFARLLARQGRAAEAVSRLSQVKSVPEPVRRELVEQLITKGEFKSAFEIWRAANSTSSESGRTATGIYDGGFEGSLSFDQGGFGWRTARHLRGASLSLDSSQPQTGLKDLRIKFDGDSNPGENLISQMVLVEPSKRYRINFAAQSQEIVTGGLPLVTASEVSGGRQRLGQSPALAKGTTGWQIYSFELTTTSQTSAVLVSLQRDCSTSPCPIFGSILLDSFSLEKLN